MITGIFLLDWALIAVSLFNAMLMLWLGLTVMLTAERRTWGVWMVEEGLLLGALFFVVHTVILGFEHTPFWQSNDLNFWWRLGWMPVILAPLAWYVVILWYTGFFDYRSSRLFRRHRLWVALTVCAGLAILLLVAFFSPMPTYTEMINFNMSGARSIIGIPILFLIYPPYALACILLPIDALMNPEPAHRMMGDLARQRSRPWLLWTTAVLLSVVLAVTFFLALISYRATTDFYPSRTITRYGIILLSGFDLILSSLVGIAVVLLGQAVVTYEVFTGKTLPRRGFLRHWRNAIILSLAMSIFVGWSLVYQPLPVYSLLIMAGITIVFYALWSWRSFVHRDYLISRLRPFVDSQGATTQMINPEDDSYSRAKSFFESVCREVITTHQAHLMPVGVLSPLVGNPLRYPDNDPSQLITPDLPLHLFDHHAGAALALEPKEYGGFLWALPLWSERGLIGVLLLGEKQDRGLYTQEEIDIARASGERIVDMLAGEQMTRRLMQLQRARLTETRVMDLRTRRALHDDILPIIHTSILRLSAIAPRENDAREVIQELSDVHRGISELIHTTPDMSKQNGTARDLIGALKLMVETEFAGEFTSVTWHTEETTPLEPLAHEIVIGAVREILRNATVHGRGDELNTPLNLTITVTNGEKLTLQIEDDGVGLLAVASTERGGAGGGLSLHSTMLAIVGGHLSVNTAGERGTQAIITLTSPTISDLNPAQGLTAD
ncbi:MAG: hypothetical protein RLP44_22660 [Aggregatilineales bacterium]